jgi:aminoglycoside phosphotransferase (APT) family kinase protein
MGRLRRFESRFERLCADLAGAGIPDTIQHDDLHMNNVYVRDQVVRVLDWGDSCISHPFASLVVTFRFLEERNGLDRKDRWFVRLRDAYLEPWGTGLTDTFDLATVVGGFAHVLAALRQRGALSEWERAVFDEDFAVRLRRALAAAGA